LSDRLEKYCPVWLAVNFIDCPEIIFYLMQQIPLLRQTRVPLVLCVLLNIRIILKIETIMLPVVYFFSIIIWRRSSIITTIVFQRRHPLI